MIRDYFLNVKILIKVNYKILVNLSIIDRKYKPILIVKKQK